MSQLVQSIKKFMLNAVDGVQVEIRYIPSTKQVSVLDVVRAVSGKDAKYASNATKRLRADIQAQFQYHKFPSASKATPVATAEVIVSIIWELPSNVAKEFRRQSARLVCQQLLVDVQLVSRYEACSNQMQMFLEGDVETTNIITTSVDDSDETELQQDQQQQQLCRVSSLSENAVSSHISMMNEEERKRFVDLQLKQMEQELELRRKATEQQMTLGRKHAELQLAIDRESLRQQSMQFYDNFKQNYMDDAKMQAALHTTVLNILQPGVANATAKVGVSAGAAGAAGAKASSTTPRSHAMVDKWVDDLSTLLRKRRVVFNSDMLMKLGRYVARRHLTVYGYRNINKAVKFVDGANRNIAVYPIDKKDFVERSVDEFLNHQLQQQTSPSLSKQTALQSPSTSPSTSSSTSTPLSSPSPSLPRPQPQPRLPHHLAQHLP